MLAARHLLRKWGSLILIFFIDSLSTKAVMLHTRIFSASQSVQNCEPQHKSRASITAHSFSSASASNTGKWITLTLWKLHDVSFNIVDGWDIYRSDHITIIDSVIDNDDDCVCTFCIFKLLVCMTWYTWLRSPIPHLALKPNSTNILVSNLLCSGSHGISVGSLGQVIFAYCHVYDTAHFYLIQFAGETDIVANVSVHNITMLNAQNGARVKVFGGSSDPSEPTSSCPMSPLKHSLWKSL